MRLLKYLLFFMTCLICTESMSIADPIRPPLQHQLLIAGITKENAQSSSKQVKNTIQLNWWQDELYDKHEILEAFWQQKILKDDNNSIDGFKNG